MNLIDMGTYIVLALAGSIVVFIGPYRSKMQVTTLLAGKRIAPEGMDADAPRGLQDAITPKLQDTFNIILPISYVIILILGSIRIWYLGIVLLVAAFAFEAIIQRFYPQDLNTYLRAIIGAMINKMADYKKTGDEMRADAAAEILEELDNLYAEIRDQKPPVPLIREAQQMRLGGK
jgi:magnesium-transporting ATPase (P-type)